MDEAEISTIMLQSSLEDESKENTLLPKPKDDHVTRHCAFCLKVCGSPGSPVKLCGRCLKRAYCSKECQQKDWSITGPGQRHNKWCGIHKYGEEDVDWEVVPVPNNNKKLCIVAKKFLPSGYKIMVEAVFCKPEDNPAAFEGRKQPKKTNEHGDRLYGSGLRTHLISHGCRSNVGVIFDDGAHATIVYAIRDIRSGEAIRMDTIPFTRMDRDRPLAGFKSLKDAYKDRESQLRKMGIVCLPNCYCKDAQARKLVQEGIKANDHMEKPMRTLEEMEKTFEIGEKFLAIQKRLVGPSLEVRASTHFILFQLAMKMKKTMMAKALQHLEAAVQIYKDMIPFSERTQMLIECLEHPEAEINPFLLAEA